jgi:hypothetical protein
LEISPCNILTEEELVGLRVPFSFKILDSKTYENLVDTFKESKIHPDSVKLFNHIWHEIDPEAKFGIEEGWIFENLPPYIDVPFNDDNALLELSIKIFYLDVGKNDIDTIEVHFEKCVVKEVFFNQIDTKRPSTVPTSASFYFKKKL